MSATVFLHGLLSAYAAGALWRRCLGVLTIFRVKPASAHRRGVIVIYPVPIRPQSDHTAGLARPGRRPAEGRTRTRTPSIRRFESARGLFSCKDLRCVHRRSWPSGGRIRGRPGSSRAGNAGRTREPQGRRLRVVSRHPRRQLALLSWLHLHPEAKRLLAVTTGVQTPSVLECYPGPTDQDSAILGLFQLCSRTSFPRRFGNSPLRESTRDYDLTILNRQV